MPNLERRGLSPGWRLNLRDDDADLVGPRAPSWWTGERPPARGAVHASPDSDLSGVTKDELRRRFENAWTLTEVLFSALQGDEAFYRPPRHGLRRPLVFYYGHPAAFHVNKLRLAGLLDEPVHADYERLFEMGVDEMSWDDLTLNDGEWPRVEEVTAYRRAVHARVLEAIERHEDVSPIAWDDPLWALLMAIEHELIHVETSSVLVRELPLRLLERPAAWPEVHPSLLPRRATGSTNGTWIDVPAAEVLLGKRRADPSYGWDNEYGELRVEVPAFRAAVHLVSNAEFLAFVEDRGYSEARWWTAEGWRWRNFRDVAHPPFWVTGSDAAHPVGLRLLFSVVDMPWSAPAIVNWHEANAYAAWRSAQEGAAFRLPSEAEHRRICGDGRADGERNLALRWGSESAVDAMPADALGLHDARGNVWQWSRDTFGPLPGFRTHRLYEDYSAPAFDGRHVRLVGGSFATAGAGMALHVRNAFRPHFVQHAGLRLVR